MFEYILKATDAGVETFVLGSWERFVDVANPFLRSLLIIAIAIIGYRILLGQMRVSLGELGYRFFVIFMIYGVIISTPALTSFFFELFTNVPGAVASYMVSEAGFEAESLNTSISIIYSRGTGAAAAIIADSGVSNPGGYFYALLVVVATFLSIGVVAFALVLSKLAVGVLLGLLPFALVLYFFQSTRSLFEGYLRQLITFALIPVLLYSVVGLMFGMVNTVSIQLHDAAREGGDHFALIGSYSLIMIVWALVSVQVLPWSAGIAGALALTTGQPLARLAALSQFAQATARARRIEVNRARVLNPQLTRGQAFWAGTRGVLGSVARSSVGSRQKLHVERAQYSEPRRSPGGKNS